MKVKINKNLNPSTFLATFQEVIYHKTMVIWIFFNLKTWRIWAFFSHEKSFVKPNIIRACLLSYDINSNNTTNKLNNNLIMIFVIKSL